MINAERSGDLFGRDVIGHHRREIAIQRELEIDRSELDKAIEGVMTGVADVDSIRHVDKCSH
jgi:hypothetical protein